MNSLLIILLKVDFYLLTTFIYFFLLLLFLIFTFICVITIYKRKAEYNKNVWQESIAKIISQAIFFIDDEDDRIDITYQIEMLLKRPSFRACLINELIQAKKNLSGSSTLNLKQLYEVLELDKDAFNKLHNSKAHIKAKGIQELAVMEQVKYVKQIFRITNDDNEMVRNEAQCALVSFYGFPGLRFLNITVHPISQWQQIQLLNKLNNVQLTNLSGIKKWLNSQNETVRIFALKLAIFYKYYDVYDDVINCLHSNVPQERLTALHYLKHLPRETTAEQILQQYAFENKNCKLAIIDLLHNIGGEEHIVFLQKQLHDNDDDIKIASAKALAALHPAGSSFLQTSLFADENPWKSIFHNIVNERAA